MKKNLTSIKDSLDIDAFRRSTREALELSKKIQEESLTLESKKEAETLLSNCYEIGLERACGLMGKRNIIFREFLLEVLGNGIGDQRCDAKRIGSDYFKCIQERSLPSEEEMQINRQRAGDWSNSLNYQEESKKFWRKKITDVCIKGRPQFISMDDNIVEYFHAYYAIDFKEKLKIFEAKFIPPHFRGTPTQSVIPFIEAIDSLQTLSESILNGESEPGDKDLEKRGVQLAYDKILAERHKCLQCSALSRKEISLPPDVALQYATSLCRPIKVGIRTAYFDGWDAILFYLERTWLEVDQRLSFKALVNRRSDNLLKFLALEHKIPLGWFEDYLAQDRDFLKSCENPDGTYNEEAVNKHLSCLAGLSLESRDWILRCFTQNREVMPSLSAVTMGLLGWSNTEKKADTTWTNTAQKVEKELKEAPLFLPLWTQTLYRYLNQTDKDYLPVWYENFLDPKSSATTIEERFFGSLKYIMEFVDQNPPKK